MKKAEQAVTEAQELVEEYTAALEEDAYYIEYEIEEKKRLMRNICPCFLKNWMHMAMS